MTARRLGALLGPLAVVLLAAASGAFDAASALFPLDLSTLGAAADTLLSEQWRSTFSSPDVQVGPLHLLLLGSLRGLARSLDLAHRLVFSVAVQTGVAAAAMVTARRVVGRRRPLIECAVGVATIFGGVGWTAYISGHPEELFIGLLWIWSGTYARQDRGIEAGLLVGLAAALKLTGVLGLPLLLLLPSTRDRVRAALVACVTGVVVYGPFLAFGPVRTFSYRWPVDNALWGRLIDGSAGFPWALRVLQGALVVAVGSFAALRLRRSSDATWAAVLVLAAVRFLSDPQPHHYFWLPFEAAAVVGAASIAAASIPWRSALAAACAYGAMTARYLTPLPGLASRLALGAILVVMSRSGSGSDDSLDPAPPGGLGPRRSETLVGGPSV